MSNFDIMRCGYNLCVLVLTHSQAERRLAHRPQRSTPEHFQKYKYKKLSLGIEIDTFTRKE